MFVRKTILLDKHNSVLGNSIQLKRKNNKIFLTSSVTNKYPVRYNNANANIGHFNHIAETPSAYVYDLNDDINEGFVKHDYSDLYDQDLLESVEMNAVEHGIIVLDDNAFISKTTLLTLNKKYYCANDYVVEVKGTGSDKGLYIYKLMDNQLTQIEYRATIELSINKPCYIINDSVDSKFLTILARDSSGIITVNELDKETNLLQVYRLGGFRNSHNYDHISVNVNDCSILTVLEYTPEVSLSFLGEYAGLFRSFTFDLKVQESINYATSFTNINYGPEAVNGLDATNYWKNDLLVFPSKNGLANVALICNNLSSIYIRLMQIDLNAEMIPSNNTWEFNVDSSKFINVSLKVQAINSKIFANVRNVKDDTYQIELISTMAISTFQLNTSAFDNLIKIFEELGENRNKWNFNTAPELLLDVNINSEQRLTPNTQFIINQNSSVCDYHKFDTPLIETNNAFKSLREQYSNPLLNRTLEDEIFDSNPNTNNTHPCKVDLPKGQFGTLSEYNQMPYWSYFCHHSFLNSQAYHNIEISEFRVYGDSSVVDTLNGKYSTNESQTTTMYYHYTNYANGGTPGGTPRNKNTSLAFDLLKEAYTDSKIFNINGKEIDLSSIVNMSKCTFIPKNIKELDYADMIVAFDFWSVEASVVPPSTMYFELDLKFYKNLKHIGDYDAEYDLVTLKAITFKPSGRYFGFSVSHNIKELFVEQYPGTFAYNIYPGFWKGNSHPTVSVITANGSRPADFLFSGDMLHFTANNYSYINKKALKNPDEYITLIKATEFTKDYEIVYINVIPIDDFTTQIRFKVKLNKGLNFKTKVAIIVDSDDLFIEFDDSKYSQLIFNIDNNSIIELKISSKQLPINNELISNILYKIEDIDTSIQYINIKDI